MKEQYTTYSAPMPPTASYEVRRAYARTYRTLTIFQAIFQATKGVFKPGPDDPNTWYGRGFRAVGLLCVYLVIAVLVYVAVQDFVKGIR
jgi:hypothetical protein